MNRNFFLAVFLFFSVSCATIVNETPQNSLDAGQSFDTFESSFPNHYERLAGIQQTAKPVENSFSVNFGPKLFSLKASYLEKRQPAADTAMAPSDGTLQRHVKVLGTTSFGGSNVIGEGELTYSPRQALPTECACFDWPRMMRLGVRSSWQGVAYGADFRSVEKGFVSLSGAATSQAREEGQLWSEYNVGAFNLRHSIGESWEEMLDAHRLRVTKAATTAVRLNRSVWGGAFASSYGLVEQGPDLKQDMTVFTNTVTGFYRPISALSLGPSFGFKQEWDGSTGFRTETPTTEFSIVYTPYKDEFRLVGGTSYSRTFNRYTLNDVTTIATRTGFDWKLGPFLGRNDFLSFNLTYNRQRHVLASGNSDDDLTGLLQLKITGF